MRPESHRSVWEFPRCTLRSATPPRESQCCQSAAVTSTDAGSIPKKWCAFPVFRLAYRTAVDGLFQQGSEAANGDSHGEGGVAGRGGRGGRGPDAAAVADAAGR